MHKRDFKKGKKMRLKKIVLALLLVASSLVAAEVNWAKDYAAGLKLAKEQNKPMLFVISRDTCKYCVLLKTTTFKDEKVVKTLNSDFIAVTSWINENDYIPKELYTPGLPGIWFLKPSGEPMFRPLMGMLKAKDFMQALGVVKTEFDKNKDSGK